jgi:hypothetical protein
MSASKVVYALLSGAGAITAIVGAGASARIYPVILPQGQTVPAIVHEVITAYRPGAIDAYASTHLTVSRVQVNLITTDYPALLVLLEAAKAAMQFQRGVFGGVTVHSVLHAGEGLVQYDQQLGLYTQPIDFLITHEAN